MTLDEAIKHAEEVAKEQKKLYGLCPASDSNRCDGTKDCIALKNGKNKGCLKCAEEHLQLAEWLKELKRLREQTRWIPVSERLPKEETDVLICNSKGNIVVARYMVFDDGTLEWYTSKWHTGEVTAWMPLPEPYKVESEDKE